MPIEDNIILAATALGSVYLCAQTLKVMNNNLEVIVKNNGCGNLVFYYNCFTFGISLGTFCYVFSKVKLDK